MARLPQRSAPFLYGILQLAITTAVATAIGVFQSVPLGAAALVRWAAAWVAAWLLMLPIVLVLSPLLHRLVAAITRESPQ